MHGPRRTTTAFATAGLLAFSGLAAFAVEGGHITLAASQDTLPAPAPGATELGTETTSEEPTESSTSAAPDDTETETTSEDAELPDPSPSETASPDEDLPRPAPAISPFPTNHGQEVSERRAHHRADRMREGARDQRGGPRARPGRREALPR